MDQYAVLSLLRTRTHNTCTFSLLLVHTFFFFNLVHLNPFEIHLIGGTTITILFLNKIFHFNTANIRSFIYILCNSVKYDLCCPHLFTRWYFSGGLSRQAPSLKIFEGHFLRFLNDLWATNVKFRSGYFKSISYFVHVGFIKLYNTYTSEFLWNMNI